MTIEWSQIRHFPRQSRLLTQKVSPRAIAEPGLQVPVLRVLRRMLELAMARTVSPLLKTLFLLIDLTLRLALNSVTPT